MGSASPAADRCAICRGDRGQVQHFLHETQTHITVNSQNHLKMTTESTLSDLQFERKKSNLAINPNPETVASCYKSNTFQGLSKDYYQNCKI